jgi:hypothetical protein
VDAALRELRVASWDAAVSTPACGFGGFSFMSLCCVHSYIDAIIIIIRNAERLWTCLRRLQSAPRHAPAPAPALGHCFSHQQFAVADAEDAADDRWPPEPTRQGKGKALAQRRLERIACFQSSLAQA